MSQKQDEDQDEDEDQDQNQDQDEDEAQAQDQDQDGGFSVLYLHRHWFFLWLQGFCSAAANTEISALMMSLFPFFSFPSFVVLEVGRDSTFMGS